MVSQPPYRILQVTDTHFAADPEFSVDGVNLRGALNAVFAQIRAEERPVDAILATGDLSEDASPESYVALRDALQTLETPVFCIPGNHDDPMIMERYLPGGWVVCTPQFELGAWQLHLLSTYLPGSPAGELGEAQRANLAAALASNAGKFALLAMHHPPLSIGSPWMDAMGCRDDEALQALVAAHSSVRGVLWGHAHQEFALARHGAMWWGTPSTGYQYKPAVSEYECDELPPGYRVIQLHADGSVFSEVIRI